MDNKPIFELLEENELNISTLYAIYAEKIPEKQAFWMQLSQEEISHVAFMNNNGFPGQQQHIIENKFTRGVIRYVMDFVLAEIEYSQKNNLNHIEALNTALRIERSILEKKCFEMLMPADTTIKELFQKMNEETEAHIRILADELKKTNLLNLD